MRETTDPLTARAVEGCSASLAAVWETRRAWLASILYAHSPRGADVDDLLQDVALKLVRGITGVRDAAALDGWLRSTAVHVAADAGRQAAARRSRPVDASPDRVVDERAAAAARARDELEAVERALDALTAEQREVLLLRSRHGLSVARIAALLGISEHAGESRLARARARLNEVLGAGDGSVVAPRPGSTER